MSSMNVHLEPQAWNTLTLKLCHSLSQTKRFFVSSSYLVGTWSYLLGVAHAVQHHFSTTTGGVAVVKKLIEHSIIHICS